MNASPWLIVFPLLAALVYAAGALWLKRTLAGGVDIWRAMAVSGWVMAAIAAPVLLLPGPPGVGGPREGIDPAGAHWYQFALVGLAGTVGSALNALALSRGDVSIATPLLGTKVILVAVLTVVVLGQPLPAVWWVAAGLATVAVMLLRGPATGTHRRFAFTATMAIAAAACYAAYDVMLQKWAGYWGALRFVPLVFIATGVLCTAMVPMFAGRLRDIPPAPRRWLLLAAALMGVQAMILTLPIAYFGGAALANIAYSSRGLFSVLMVWAVGHWFGNREREAGGGVMLSRAAGAVTLLVAIVLVVRQVNG